MIDQIFKKFMISYIIIFFIAFLMVTTVDFILNKEFLNYWKLNMGIQSVISVFTSWGLIYCRDPRWINWMNRVFRGKQPTLNVPEPVGVKKKKKKPKDDIERLRSKYGGK